MKKGGDTFVLEADRDSIKQLEGLGATDELGNLRPGGVKRGFIGKVQAAFVEQQRDANSGQGPPCIHRGLVMKRKCEEGVRGQCVPMKMKVDQLDRKM
jgi:hypothetical protein